MTLLIGMNLGSYAIIGADTRVCWYLPSGEFRFRDDDEKIQETSLGLITGAGLLDILDPVKERLAVEPVQHTGQLTAMMREAREGFQSTANWSAAHPAVWEAFEITGWLFTYMNASDPPTLRLALARSSTEYACELLVPNKSIVSMPGGTTEEQQVSLNDWMDEQVCPLASPSDFQQNVTHHIKIIARAMKAMAQYQSVASTFQVGIHTADGLVGVSSILPGPNWSIELKPRS